MRLLYVRLENYIGIFNGRGDDVLEIDMSKSNSNIFIIRGYNGSGKSTLLKALTPVQDDNTAIIYGVQGRKILDYNFNGTIYRIEYIHPVTKSGERGQVKAQVYKNGEELNPTWNVSQAKEIIYSLFNLDQNFLSLSQLSSDDRGLADKKPAERKRFVNSIINGIEVYNNIYKTISKKHSVYKNMINTLSSKISKLGNPEELELRFNSITRQAEEAYAKRDTALIEAAAIKSKIESLEKDNDIDSYRIKEAKLANLMIESNKAKEFIESHMIFPKEQNRPDDIIDAMNYAYDYYNNKLIANTAIINSKRSELENLNKSYSELSTTIQDKIAQNQTLFEYGISDNDIKLFETNKDKLNRLNDDLKSFDFNLSASEASTLIDAIMSIRDYVDSIYNGLDVTSKEEKIQFLSSNSTIDTLDINRSIESIKDELSTLESDMSYFSDLERKTESLSLRPKDCKIDSCPFIKEANEAALQRPTERVAELDTKIKESKIKLNTLTKDLEIAFEFKDVRSRFNTLKQLISGYSNLIKKSSFNFLLDDSNLLDLDINLHIHNELNHLRAYYNTVISRDQVLDIVDRLKDPMMKYEANKKFIDSLSNEITSLRENITKYQNDIEIYKYDISKYSTRIDEINKGLKSLEICKEYGDMYENALPEIKSLQSSMVSMERVINELSVLYTNLKASKAATVRINDIVNELLSERDVIAYNKTLLDEYVKELAEYNENYQKLETVKFYVSPTTGIQTIFMGTYMNSIIIKANELLSLIFNGQFVIQPFIINESEFRIPCLGSGLMNDDISSMSTSQICMISMILSFAILANSSTSYNILKLDEIDGGLDTENRIQFIGLLKQLIQMVGCEQCFLISHNMEYDENVSIIDMTSRPVVVS